MTPNQCVLLFLGRPFASVHPLGCPSPCERLRYNWHPVGDLKPGGAHLSLQATHLLPHSMEPLQSGPLGGWLPTSEGACLVGSKQQTDNVSPLRAPQPTGGFQRGPDTGQPMEEN